MTNEPVGLVVAGILTVDNFKTNYIHRQIEKAERASKFQSTSGATTVGVIRTIDLIFMFNYLVTHQSIKDALHLFGPSLPNLKGKTVRAGSKQVDLTEEIITSIPLLIISRYGQVILSIDVVKIN